VPFSLLTVAHYCFISLRVCPEKYWLLPTMDMSYGFPTVSRGTGSIKFMLMHSSSDGAFYVLETNHITEEHPLLIKFDQPPPTKSLGSTESTVPWATDLPKMAQRIASDMHPGQSKSVSIEVPYCGSDYIGRFRLASFRVFGYRPGIL
jgi:hypothetical protein